jgi:hypothetical protein
MTTDKKIEAIEGSFILRVYEKTADEFMKQVNLQLANPNRRIIHTEIYETNNHYSCWIEALAEYQAEGSGDE